MTQQVYDPIDPVPTSGTLLASLLNGLRLSILSGHSGNSRPSYAQAGTGWFNVSASPWVYNIFDGSHDVPLFDLNPTTGAMRLYHAGAVLGAMALKNTVGSGDIDNGAVGTNALGSKVVTQGKLGDASVGAQQIKAAEKADILTVLFGTATNGRVIRGNGTTYELALPQVSVASDDLAPGYLFAKMLAGSLLETEVVTDGGIKKVKIKLAVGTPNTVIGFDSSGNPTALSMSAGIVISRTVLTASGTYSKPANLLYVDVELVGGGGGGGGAKDGSFAGGGGGGAGGYSRKVIPAASLAASETVTVGTGGGAGNNTGTSNGGTGTTTSFGTHLSATGGSGGAGAPNTGGARQGGAGGLGIGGDINVPGSPGGSGFGSDGTIDVCLSGYGGSSHLGGGGIAIASNGTGNNGAANTGSGGSGSAALGTTGNKVGSSGADGIVIVTEYRSA